MSAISANLTAPPDNFSTTLSSGISDSDLTIPLNSVAGLATEGVGVLFTKDANGDVIAGSVEIVHWTGVAGSSLTLTNTGDRGLTGSDSGAQAYATGAYFEVWVTSYYYDSLLDGIALNIPATYLDTDGTLAANSDVKIPSQKAVKTYADTKLSKAGGTLTGEVDLGENAGLVVDAALSADGKYSGIVEAGTAGAALAFGQLCYLDPTDSRWELCDANSALGADGDARGKLGICVLAAAGDGSATKMLLWGKVRADAQFPAMTINAPLYVGETAGEIVVAMPTTALVLVRVIGIANTADELFFCPTPVATSPIFITGDAMGRHTAGYTSTVSASYTTVSNILIDGESLLTAGFTKMRLVAKIGTDSANTGYARIDNGASGYSEITQAAGPGNKRGAWVALPATLLSCNIDMKRDTSGTAYLYDGWYVEIR